ncbi:MAG: sigma-70 family RNA polymerase sigma factor [Polyangiales bacterium]
MTAPDTGRAASAFALGTKTWPDLLLDYCLFEQYLRARGLSAVSVERQLAQDLYLACACTHDVAGAIAAFDARYRQLIDHAARSFDASPNFVDDVRQELNTQLFVTTDGQPPRISQYNARGPLAGFVTTAARRVALRLAKRRSARKFAGEDALVMQVCKEHDPELEWLRTRYSEVFNDALMLAFRQLSQRDRLILRLHAQRGLSMGRIAKMYNVTQPTISRWMRDAREQILAAVYETLRAECHVEADDLDSLVRLVQSQLDLNLSTLFQTSELSDAESGN